MQNIPSVFCPDRHEQSMQNGFPNSRKLISLVLAAWMAQLPLISIQSLPNDVFVVISHYGTHLCLVKTGMLDLLQHVVAIDCGSGNDCELVIAEPVADCSTCAGENESENDQKPVCPTDATCCMCVQLSNQPLFTSEYAVSKPNQPLLGVIRPGDETANFINIKPLLPPPKNC